jgi:uncharacterized SAM-binding protein YcdF (DUF218 family)
MMTYGVKHLIGALLSPLTLALVVAGLAVLCRRRQWSRLARGLAIAAVAIAYLGSTSLIGDLLLLPLESRYAPLRQEPLPENVGFVIALGSGYDPRGDFPITAALDREGLTRIVEAVRLVRRLPASKLIASGGAPDGEPPPARGYARLARELGVEAASISVLDGGLDTAAEAGAIAGLIGGTPAILVTSAYHMPRAMREMRRAGVNVTAAPTGQLVHHLRPADWTAWLPNGSGLQKSERALHEYAGLMAQWVRSP